MKLIVLGIEQMNPGLNIMKTGDLLLKRDELISFLGIAGDCETSDWKFKSPLRFDSRGDDGIVPEDLFRFVRIGRFAPDADTCSPIIGKLGTTKAEGIGRLAYQR